MVATRKAAKTERRQPARSHRGHAVDGYDRRPVQNNPPSGDGGYREDDGGYREGDGGYQESDGWLPGKRWMAT